jgi:uncharacterized protein with ATP-grasp and redox domains
MKPMRIQEACRDCLIRLVDLTVDLATPDPELQEAARTRALAIIDGEFHPGAIPALIANRYHLEIQRITGNPDPFLQHKRAETTLLKRHFRAVAPGFPDTLESLLKLAVLGNTVDFFRSEQEVKREFSNKIHFAISHLAAFQELLDRETGTILYLADNAGEQFFDLPLVRHLRGLGRQVFYVIKGAPIQNDLSRADLDDSGLYAALEPVLTTGARTVGLVLGEASSAFQEAFQQASIIVAKGMGHFETLSHLPDPRLFFLLQAKCVAVAQSLGVSRGSFLFVRAAEISP